MPNHFIPYGCQYIDHDDIEAVVQALRDPLITQGPLVEKFEAGVAAYSGARYAVAFNSGTSALHAAMFAAGIGSGDEVITSPITFVASANAAVYKFLNRRHEIARRYDQALGGLDWLQTSPRPTDDSRHAYHLYPVLLKSPVNRLEFFNYMRSCSIGVQVHYIPVHLQPYYQRTFGYQPGDFPVAEDFYTREISLPMYYALSDEEQEYVLEKIINF